MELPTFGSPSPLSRFSSRSLDDETREESCFIVTDDKEKIKDTSTNNIDNMFNQFHFSIYKWAGRGVPMLNDFKSKNILSDSRKQPMRTSHEEETKEDTVVSKKTELKKPIPAFLNEQVHQGDFCFNDSLASHLFHTVM